MRRFNPNALLWLILYAAPLAFAVSQTDLLTQVRGILAAAHGGTGIAYFTAAGPTTARTYTFRDASSTIPSTICSGTITLPTTLMATGTKYGATASTVLDTACSGALTSDNVKLDFASDPSGVTGYAPTANGTLTIVAWCIADHIYLYLYNNTAGSITPGAMTLNYHVWR